VELKDWLAKRAGVNAYGGVMGREAVKNGLALGRWLYLGHGMGVPTSDVFVFENDDDMKAKGLTLIIHCGYGRRTFSSPLPIWEDGYPLDSGDHNR
jgi:hypothetical protein